MEMIHIFEQAGLGIAPFEFETAFWGEFTSCQFCGTPIKERCIIKDSLGKQFYVGNECVNKTGDEGLIDKTQEAIKILRRERKREREEKKILDGKLLLNYSEELKNHLANTLVNPDRPQSSTVLEKVTRDYTAYWSSKKSKLEASDIIFKAAETLNLLEGFWEVRDEILAQLEAQKEKERQENEVKAEVARQERAKHILKVQEENKELINVLSSSRPSPFIQEMIWKLKAQELEAFSIRQVEVLADIYGKTFGKQGSAEYQEAYSKIYKQGMR